MAFIEQDFQEGDNGGRHTKVCKFISVEIKVGNLLYPQPSTPSWLGNEVEFSFQIPWEQNLRFIIFFIKHKEFILFIYVSIRWANIWHGVSQI